MHDVNTQTAIWPRCARHAGPSTMNGGLGVSVQSIAVGVQRYSFVNRTGIEVHGVPDGHIAVVGKDLRT